MEKRKGEKKQKKNTKRKTKWEKTPRKHGDKHIQTWGCGEEQE